jgi:hypothetical protein
MPRPKCCLGNQVVLFYEIRVKRGDDLSLQKTTIFRYMHDICVQNATENKERIIFKCANGHDCENAVAQIVTKGC